MPNTLLKRFLNSRSDNRKSKIENRKWVGLFPIVVTLAMCGARPEAQQPAKVPRIGWLTGGSFSATADRVEAFRQGLRELGYVEGKNIVVEWRGADGNRDRQRALASELVRPKVDLIVTAGAGGTRAAKEATTTIPIVMTQDDDPVGTGHVASLARPGGNITGLASLSPELGGKRLDLLKEIVLKLSRVAVFATSASTDYAQTLKEIELAAGALGVKLQHLDILGPKDIETAFRAASKERADAALMQVSGPILNIHQKQLIELAIKSRLPVTYNLRSHAEAGGLMSYGIYLPDLDRRAATYVDKILKGAKPADLPVEQPRKFELVINLKTAKQIGLTIPQRILQRADRVIK
jgi:ABC-type uncharacterized transport system substrate-binding protein